MNVSIFYQTMESPNPFTYSDTANTVKSKVKSLSFTDPDGNTISVEDSEPIDIYMEGMNFASLGLHIGK